MQESHEDTQEFGVPVSGDAEIEWLLARLAPLVSATDEDPRRRLLAALIAAWPGATDGRRFDAARILLTLEQRDVWFLTSHDPVEALDDAAAGLMVALGDAITATGANFSFDADPPVTATRRADHAYAELGDAIRAWKAEVVREQHRRTGLDAPTA
jgi:hypothetical protein